MQPKETLLQSLHALSSLSMADPADWTKQMIRAAISEVSSCPPQSCGLIFICPSFATQLLLSGYSQTEDIVVATIVDNRKRPELADVIGPFANNVALRSSLSGQQALRPLTTLLALTLIGKGTCKIGSGKHSRQAMRLRCHVSEDGFPW